VVGNGRLPARTITTGVGPVEVSQRRVHDRRIVGVSEQGEPIDESGQIVERFSSKILPPYLRKTRSIEELIPWLYLKGISTGGFTEALQALLGPDAPGLSATTITRLLATWQQDFAAWNTRSLQGKQYVYVWADGVHFNIRLEEDRQCILVLMGATQEGKKELIAVADGFRESAQSWLQLLLDCKQRGMVIDPKLAVADGALGFWKALPQVFPTTREQRCWVHKTANVLDKMSKRVQTKAKEKLHDIWMAPTRADGYKAFDAFAEMFHAKYPAAVECLQKDRDVLLTFYDFPAEHWMHIRTTNPIESTFATVRLRHRKTKGSGSRLACLTMVFKLMESASKTWRALNGSTLVTDVIAGVQFTDGAKKVAA
jgi:transposase-like protein